MLLTGVPKSLTNSNFIWNPVFESARKRTRVPKFLWPSPATFCCLRLPLATSDCLWLLLAIFNHRFGLPQVRYCNLKGSLYANSRRVCDHKKISFEPSLRRDRGAFHSLKPLGWRKWGIFHLARFGKWKRLKIGWLVPRKEEARRFRRRPLVQRLPFAF